MSTSFDFDFAPLWRSTIGFDRLFGMLEEGAQVEPTYSFRPTTSRRPATRLIGSQVFAAQRGCAPAWNLIRQTLCSPNEARTVLDHEGRRANSEHRQHEVIKCLGILEDVDSGQPDVEWHAVPGADTIIAASCGAPLEGDEHRVL
jgi:hypothetical protein